MRKHISLFLLMFFTLLFVPGTTLAQEQTIQQPEQEFYKARILSVEEEGQRDIAGKKQPYQLVRVSFTDTSGREQTETIEYGGMIFLTDEQRLKQGDTVVLMQTTQEQDGKEVTIHRIIDHYRLPSLLWLIAGFFIFVLLLARKKGLGSIVGMGISLGVIMFFIVPRILAGNDPLLISIIGSFIIMLSTIYLAHGFSQRTNIAVASTTLSLIITGILAIVFVKFSHLYGLGSEDTYNLLQGFGSTIQFQGLLLGGIIIGALGVLDDVTTTQSATIAELAQANESYTLRDLFSRGMVVGREHIASLVNTLVLAYAGAGIGMFIYISLGLQNGAQPWWVIFNSEVIAEEIVRTLVGSIGLILAVPITTLLAAFFARYSLKVK